MLYPAAIGGGVIPLRELLSQLSDFDGFGAIEVYNIPDMENEILNSIRRLTK